MIDPKRKNSTLAIQAVPQKYGVLSGSTPVVIEIYSLLTAAAGPCRSTEPDV